MVMKTFGLMAAIGKIELDNVDGGVGGPGEARVPKEHPPRIIKDVVDEEFEPLSGEYDGRYSKAAPGPWAFGVSR